MTPAEANQARRDAAIGRSHRIDRLDFAQLLNFIHRLAAIEPDVVDRVLAEFDANAPRSRSEPKLHPVTFSRGLWGLVAFCQLQQCAGWHLQIEDGHNLPYLERRVREHSGIES